MKRRLEPGNGRKALVVKIGGSLQDRVQGLVPVLLSSGRPLLIVPGGGKFADAVRDLGLEDDPAHWMAVAAMDQFGWYIASHGMEVTPEILVPEIPKVLLPYTLMRKTDPLPHTWEVTSDTIAAWVAGILGIDLLVLKSTDGIQTNGILQNVITAPVKTEAVDSGLVPFVLENRIGTMIVNGRKTGRVRRFLEGKPVPGTRIGTTFF